MSRLKPLNKQIRRLLCHKQGIITRVGQRLNPIVFAYKNTSLLLYYIIDLDLIDSLTDGSLATLDSFTRGDADATVTDFEGLVKQVTADEARFVGARHVRNHVHSQNMATEWDAPSGCTAVYDESTDVTTVTTTSTLAFLLYGLTAIPLGEKVRVSVEARRIAGSTSVALTNGDAAGAVTDINLTSEWQRFACNIGTTTSAPSIGIFDTSITIGTIIEFRNWQYEIVTGQSNQNPSEFISVCRQDLVAEGYFNNGNVGWTVNDAGGGVATFSGGKLNLSVGTGIPESVQVKDNSVSIIPGERYRVRFTISNWTGAPTTALVQVGNAQVNLSGNGTYDQYVKATSNDGALIYLLGVASAGSFDIDNLTVTLVDTGSNVDDVQYFDRLNGNTVVNNVVIPASGAAIADGLLKGLLNEPARTNAVYPYNDFDPATAWTPQNMAASFPASATVVNPDGTPAQEAWDNASTTGGHSFYSVQKALSGSPALCGSFYFHEGTANQWVAIRIADPGGATDGVVFYYDLTNGVLGTGTEILGINWTLIDANITPTIWPGWYRCHLIVQTDATYANARMTCHLCDADGSRFYNANPVGGTSRMTHVWGAQLEEGLFPTSIIPALTGALARNVELTYYVPPDFFSGSAVNDFTWECQFTTNEADPTIAFTGSTGLITQIVDSGLTDGWSLFVNSSGELLLFKLGALTSVTGPVLAANTTYKVSLSFSSTDGMSMTVNGGTPYTNANTADMDYSSTPVLFAIGHRSDPYDDRHTGYTVRGIRG